MLWISGFRANTGLPVGERGAGAGGGHRSQLTCRPLFPTLASRLVWKHTSSLKVANEPILAFTQGSPEREALQKVRQGRGTQRVQGLEQSLQPLPPPAPDPSPGRKPGVWGELCVWRMAEARSSKVAAGASLEPQSRSGLISPRCFMLPNSLPLIASI